jgi:hypothetical protein
MRRNDPLLAPPRSASPRVTAYSPYYLSLRIPLLQFTEMMEKESDRSRFLWKDEGKRKVVACPV